MHDDLIDPDAPIRLAEIAHPDGHLHAVELGLFQTVGGGEHPVLGNQGAATVIAPLTVAVVADGHHPAGRRGGGPAENTRHSGLLPMGDGCK
ncbi:hypothetical protein D3C80_802510 [compost metagenome]